MDLFGTVIFIAECPSSWYTSANKSSSSSYTGIGLANFSSCFSYCRFTDSCNGIAFDNSSWPFCKVFSSFDFADPHNLIENPSSTMYLFDKKECLGKHLGYVLLLNSYLK